MVEHKMLTQTHIRFISRVCEGTTALPSVNRSNSFIDNVFGMCSTTFNLVVILNNVKTRILVQ